MKLVSIRTDLLQLYQQDKEVMQKSGRPYVAVLRLRYCEHNYDFAVPIRSNIPAAAPKYQYFALPPRPTTRPRNRHGLHYIKMFPVTKQYLDHYAAGDKPQYSTDIDYLLSLLNDRNA